MSHELRVSLFEIYPDLATELRRIDYFRSDVKLEISSDYQ